MANVSVTIPGPLYAHLAEQARERNRSVEQHIADILHRELGIDPQEPSDDNPAI